MNILLVTEVFCHLLNRVPITFEYIHAKVFWYIFKISETGLLFLLIFVWDVNEWCSNGNGRL